MDIAKLRELLAAAAQGQWARDGSEVFSLGNNRVVASRPDFSTTPTGHGQWPANAALIVALRNNAESLLARLEALELFVRDCADGMPEATPGDCRKRAIKLAAYDKEK